MAATGNLIPLRIFFCQLNPLSLNFLLRLLLWWSQSPHSKLKQKRQLDPQCCFKGICRTRNSCGITHELYKLVHYASLVSKSSQDRHRRGWYGKSLIFRGVMLSYWGSRVVISSTLLRFQNIWCKILRKTRINSENIFYRIYF